MNLTGISIPINTIEGSLPVRLGSPVDEQAARGAWINYSTPLWRRAGRSEAWILLNIVIEWGKAKDDIIRRYLAGDFGVAPITIRPDILPEPPPPAPGAETWKDHICPRCSSRVRSWSQALAPQYLIDIKCPVCGYDFGRKGTRISIVERKPWPPTPVPFPPVPPLALKCLVCGATFAYIEELRDHMTSAHPEEVTVLPDWLIKQINDALDQYEEKIIELEEALRTAQAAEFYNNPYGTIEAHAQTLLNQFDRYQPTAQWPLELSTRWSELRSRLQKLIIDARTAAKQRRPIPTYEEAIQEQQGKWITGTIAQLRERGLTWSDVRVSYPQPGEIGINGRARWPDEGGIPPFSELYTEVPIAFPDYSVEERIQEASEQEPWQLAEALPPAPPKKITPYLILVGLGVTTAAVWYYKKKKKKAR